MTSTVQIITSQVSKFLIAPYLLPIRLALLSFLLLTFTLINCEDELPEFNETPYRALEMLSLTGIMMNVSYFVSAIILHKSPSHLNASVFAECSSSAIWAFLLLISSVMGYIGATGHNYLTFASITSCVVALLFWYHSLFLFLKVNNPLCVCCERKVEVQEPNYIISMDQSQSEKA